MKKSLFRIVVYFLGVSNLAVLPKCLAQTRIDNSAILNHEKVIYEIPMAYELMHVAIALTDTTNVANGYNIYNEIISKDSHYYKEVMRYFEPYKKHVLIKDLNKKLQRDPSNVIYNVQLGNNLYFNNQKLSNIKIMPWLRRTFINLKSVDKKKVEDFAKTSNFQKFYNEHKEYYQSVLKESKLNANINRQQEWLENEFPIKYDNYRIIISPLMGSTHFTQRFKMNGQKKCIMWVTGFTKSKKQQEYFESAAYIGLVMTEIDHNYVNPVSDNFKKSLNNLMGGKNRVKWTNGGVSNAYKSGYSVFNEYMTHAVYLLYINQQSHLSKDEKIQVTNAKIEGMIKRRKFNRFGDFYEQLSQLHRSKKQNETMKDLYPKLNEWCLTENKK